MKEDDIIQTETAKNIEKNLLQIFTTPLTII